MLITRVAIADPGPVPPAPPFTHLNSPRVACLGTPQDPTECVQLQRGFYMDEPSFTRLDVEMKRLQDLETRLTAENKSLRQKVESWSPGWKLMTVTLLSGVGLGVYAAHKL